jgi:TetR/AcrR family transcriptional regulator, regulator of cefoperazone and chloramphenicol sensitivity
MEDKMKIPREDTTRTRKSLLAAACEIFAEKGYRDTTIAEISERAGTNIAAINYHFGNKETLYVEAWRCAFHESLKTHPPDGGVSDNAPAEERFRAHVKATIGRLADKNNREFWFVQREFANPTGLLEEVMKKEINPLQKKTEGLVRELLGPLVSDTDVKFCEISIISQCFNPMVAGSKIPEKNTQKMGPPRIKDIKAFTEHVVEFSLAGIQEVRKNAKMKSFKKNKEKKE